MIVKAVSGRSKLGPYTLDVPVLPNKLKVRSVVRLGSLHIISPFFTNAIVINASKTKQMLRRLLEQVPA